MLLSDTAMHHAPSKPPKSDSALAAEAASSAALLAFAATVDATRVADFAVGMVRELKALGIVLDIPQLQPSAIESLLSEAAAAANAANGDGGVHAASAEQ